MDQGEIYRLTFPNGKNYIGQCVCRLANGKAYGTRARWMGHITDSKRENGGNCRKLNYAIRKYGEQNVKIDILLTTHISLLDLYEEMSISLFESTNRDQGYNLRSGGNRSRASQETRLLMRESRLKYTLPPHTKETKQKISNTVLDNVKRIDHNEIQLPKYVKYINWKDRNGYAIVSHPQCKIKYFVSNKLDLNELYTQCINHLTTL